MKQTLVIGIIVSCVAGMSLGAAPPVKDATVALVSKVIADVTRRDAGGEWQQAKRGATLISGDRVKTGEKSLAVIKFKDNSMVRVRERTEVTIKGMQEGTSFSKSADVERGVIGFSIKKQQKGEEFRFSSPTAVASIRGTSGQFGAEDSSDKLVVLEGLVQLTNKLSQQSADVAAGFTGVSFPDGKLQVRPSTPDEKLVAQLASRVGDQDNTLDLELDNGKGTKKRFEIKFK